MFASHLSAHPSHFHSEKADYTFEANNMTINFGMWFMKHAAAVADYAAPQT